MRKSEGIKKWMRQLKDIEYVVEGGSMYMYMSKGR